MGLVKPTIKYQESYLRAVEEAKDETGVTTISKPKERQSFEEFVKNKREEAEGKHLPEGWVPATELWLIDDNEFIGWVNIRHTLTKHLLEIGGHIGYWVRPSKRGQGYGKELLKQGIKEAKKLGIQKILVTCDATNIPSAKIIQENGGVLENGVNQGLGMPKKNRYWITVK